MGQGMGQGMGRLRCVEAPLQLKSLNACLAQPLVWTRQSADLPWSLDMLLVGAAAESGGPALCRRKMCCRSLLRIRDVGAGSMLNVTCGKRCINSHLKRSQGRILDHASHPSHRRRKGSHVRHDIMRFACPTPSSFTASSKTLSITMTCHDDVVHLARCSSTSCTLVVIMNHPSLSPACGTPRLLFPKDICGACGHRKDEVQADQESAPLRRVGYCRALFPMRQRVESAQ